MTYPELKIALDIGDPEIVLHNLNLGYYEGKYLVVCDDGDIHCFDENGKEQRIDYIQNCFFSTDCLLKKIIIPKTVKTIEKWAFSYCSGLMSVTIPNNVTYIGYCAFEGCKGLMDVTIGKRVTRINAHAFFNCHKLKSLVFKGKTLEQVESMVNYPWGITDMSIIQAGL